MEITHQKRNEIGFFLAEEAGTQMGYLTYERQGDALFSITHTVVEKAFQGRGVAKALLNEAVAFAREKGYKIIPVCSYVETMFQRDPSYNDVNAENK